MVSMLSAKYIGLEYSISLLTIDPIEDLKLIHLNDKIYFIIQ